MLLRVGSLVDPKEPEKIVAEAGKVDVVIANLTISAPATPAAEVTDNEWDEVFEALGVEVAKHNINVNAIAQNFVDNPSYFPEEIQANPKFQDRLKREVPLGRFVSASEDASFVAYLCSEEANCFVGQVFPVCGGWIHR